MGYVWSEIGKSLTNLEMLREASLVDLPRALELLAIPKRGRGGRTALKDLGIPVSAMMVIKLLRP